MIKYYSSYFLVVSCFAHLICCGLPIVLSFNTVFANLFFLQSLTQYFEFFEKFENFFFGFVSTIFFLIIFIELYNKKIKCSEVDNCSDIECAATKKKIRFNIFFSSGLYFVNSYLFFSEKFL